MPAATNGSGSLPKMVSQQDSLSAAIKRIDVDSQISEEDRMEALLSAYRLIARLETPWEFVLRQGMNQPALAAALKIFIDLNLFANWHALGDKPLSAQDVAHLSSCAPELSGRLLRHLAANNILQETTTGHFQPTNLSISFTQPVFREWINHMFDATIPLYFALPVYCRTVEYKSPDDARNGVFQYAKNCNGRDMFEYYAEHTREGASFNHVMGAVMLNQATWTDIFPCENLFTTAGDGPLVVDVGGNVGHDIEKFRLRYPHTARQLYLEDRPEVVKNSTCPPEVTRIGLDFFQPQPVKGARAYYMHGVLHDWPDKEARQILENQKTALKPGYSTLLIHDHVAPENEPLHPHTTSYDLTMMIMVAGKERSEKQWQTLLQETGYKLVKVWRSPLAVQCVIEAELAE